MAKADLPLVISPATCPLTLHCQARLAAVNAVKQRLWQQHIKIASIPRRTIIAEANEYLRSHPELIEQAAERDRNYPGLRTLAEKEIRERMRKQRCPA
jgi:hypothetical protein